MSSVKWNRLSYKSGRIGLTGHSGLGLYLKRNRAPTTDW